MTSEAVLENQKTLTEELNTDPNGLGYANMCDEEVVKVMEENGVRGRLGFDGIRRDHIKRCRR